MYDLIAKIEIALNFLLFNFFPQMLLKNLVIVPLDPIN